MPIFLATLSVQGTSHDYSPLWNALEGAGAKCLMDATWLVDVSQDALTVTNALLSHCVTGDKLFVLEFVAGAAWTGTCLDADAKEWLARRMSISKAGRKKPVARIARARTQVIKAALNA